MKKSIVRDSGIARVVFVGMLFSHIQVGLAGWNGAMNGTGFGKASVNVVSSQEATRTVTSINMTNPSVAMTINTDYAYSALLPKDSSLATVAKVKGAAGYIWQATTVGSNGDSTDSSEFGGVQINPADCASLEMVSSSVIAPDDKSGTITVNALATAGTALRVRGYEALGTLPIDEPDTTVDETLAFLKAHGALKWDITLLGPFNLNTTNCNALVIPFTIETGTANLYFVTDGVAKSLPIIKPPEDIIVQCGQPVVYPDLDDLGAGDGVISLTYDPPLPPGGIFPLGVTPVTVSTTSASGCPAIFQFNVINTLDFNGFYPPINSFDAGTCEVPVRTVKLGNNLPVKFDVSCGGSAVTTGHPTLKIEKPSGGCSSLLVTIGGGEFQRVGNEWHFNWNTGSGGVTAGPHKLTATLQDGTQKYVWVKLK